jgi:molybdopterin-containing oxidoreductase family membrane subunit
MWTALGLMASALILVIIPSTRKDGGSLSISCLAIFVGTWIDKGLGLITGGFVPTPLHEVVEYIPTLPERVISCGVYGIGVLIPTVLIKVAVTVKKDRAPQIT